MYVYITFEHREFGNVIVAVLWVRTGVPKERAASVLQYIDG